MISAFVRSLKAMVRNPGILLPAFVVILFASIVMLELIAIFFGELLEFFFVDEALTLGLWAAIAASRDTLGGIVLLILGAFMVSSTLTLMLLFFYSKYAMHAEEKDAYSNALKHMFLCTGKSIALTFFFIVYGLIAFTLIYAVFWILSFLMLELAVLGFFLVSLLVLLGAIKLAIFTAPAIVFEDSDVRTGISASWNLTGKKLPGVLIALLIIFFSSGLLMNVSILISAYSGNGILASIIYAIFDSLIFAFASLFFAFYYFENPVETKKHSKKTRGKKK